MDLDYTAYRYSDALLPLTWNICGVELKPLSLGHLMILERVGNPLIANDEKNFDLSTGMYWFFSALLICGQTYEENISILNDEDKHKSLMDDFVINLVKNMDSDASWNIFDKISLFKEYVGYYMDVPIYTEERPSTDKLPSGIDWKQNMYLVFKKMGYGDMDIYNMNIRRLFFEWCSYAESEGGIKVMNKFDLQMMGKL